MLLVAVAVAVMVAVMVAVEVVGRAAGRGQGGYGGFGWFDPGWNFSLTSTR